MSKVCEYEKENKKQRADMDEKDKIIKIIMQKNENIVKKNCSLEKENKTSKLAFNESLFEREKIRKELESQNEAMNEILKQNTSLNDEVKVKTEIIKLLREEAQSNSDEQHTEEVKDKESDNEESIEEEIQEVPADKVKCTECDYQTSIRTHIRSHMMAHRGQYQCQRGCKESFKTLNILDEHHRSKHTTPDIKQFECEVCSVSFTSLHYLRQHVTNKHEKANRNKPMQINCEICGLIASSNQEFLNNKRECNGEFERVANKICKYFVNGGCLKNENCRFSHRQEKQFRSAPN